MKSRFEGASGHVLLVEALESQRLVENNVELSRRLADEGELNTFAPGQELLVQNAEDNDVLFIIDGQALVTVNGRQVATRGPRDSLGEMVLIDASARRSATVTAMTGMCVLRVAESSFRAIADDHPRVWRAIARVVAERMRERNQFHRQPNARPVVFVGSSVEGLDVARQLQLGLKHAAMDVVIWTNGVFGPGGIAIDALLAQVARSDFAAFVFGPDDLVASRASEGPAPRDNVIFEIGLFMGVLGRERCLVVKEHSTEIKIPSDLFGVAPLTYVQSKGTALAAAAISTVCTELEGTVARLGVR